jgi:hypothetical protein
VDFPINHIYLDGPNTDALQQQAIDIKLNQAMSGDADIRDLAFILDQRATTQIVDAYHHGRDDSLAPRLPLATYHTHWRSSERQTPSRRLGNSLNTALNLLGLTPGLAARC